MYSYILAFLFSCLFVYLSGTQRNKIVKNIFLWIGLLIPCFLAGFRADTIGTDVKVYVEPIYSAAKASKSIFDYFQHEWYLIWRYKSVKDYEIGFTLLVYLVTKVFGSLSAVLFFIHLLIIVPIFKALEYRRNRLSIWFGMFVFFALNYNVSLNMMRQWIAMAFLLYGSRYLIENKRLKYFYVVVLAMMFHTSAIIGGIIYVIYNYVMSDSIRIKIRFRIGNTIFDMSAYKVIAVTAASIIALIVLSLIANILKYIGLSQFVGYINGNIYLVPNQILVRIPVILLFIINYRNIVRKNKEAPFWLTMLLVDLVLSQLVSVNAYSFRISTFFAEYSIISIPTMIKSIPSKGGRKLIVSIIIILYLIFYWWFYFVFMGMHATVPYISIWGS